MWYCSKSSTSKVSLSSVKKRRDGLTPPPSVIDVTEGAVNSTLIGFPVLSRNCREINTSLIARFMGPTWGPSGADRTQVRPMLAPWTLLSGIESWQKLPICQRWHLQMHLNEWKASIFNQIPLMLAHKSQINNSHVSLCRKALRWRHRSIIRVIGNTIVCSIAYSD